MHLFIDTNILLSFYHFADDDLDELKKLVVLLKQKKLTLHVPRQVVAEFRRNRETKIADALKKLREQQLNLQFPQICRDYPEYEELRRIQKAYEAEHAKLLNSLVADIENQKLKADEIIGQLLNLADKIDCSDEIVRNARDRFDLGNPPGKKGSLGDAVNWVALLAEVPKESDLHFITDDKDYRSALDDEAFSGFLTNEWYEEKKSSVVFYRRLSAFFKDHFPHIKLATELEKDLLISDLAQSSSFARTHIVVAKLSKYTDFTPAQLNAIVLAAVSNSQISSIMDDPDIHRFFSEILKGQEALIEDDNLNALNELLSPPHPDEIDPNDIPF